MTPDAKMNAALGRVAMKHPFFAPFVLKSYVEEMPEDLQAMLRGWGLKPTMATDGKTIYWAREFVDEISAAEVEGVIVHEVYHIIFKHHLRIRNRQHMTWNMATDYVIDPMVLASNFKLPSGPGMEMHHDKQYDGKTAESVYELLLQKQPDCPQCGGTGQQPDDEQGDQGGDQQGDQAGGQDGGQGGQQGDQQGGQQGKQSSGEHKPGGSKPCDCCNGSGKQGHTQTPIGVVLEPKGADGKPMSEAERRQAESDIDQQVVVAAEIAKRRGIGSLPSRMQEYIDKLLEPKVDFEDHILRFVGGEQPEGYDTSRFERHQFCAEDLYEPDVEYKGVGHIVVGIDTSGSVSTQELRLFLGVLNVLSEQFKPELLTVIHCDADVRHVEEYIAGETIEEQRFNGRGGTRVRPVFDYVEQNIDRVDKLIYLTDMGVSDWGEEPGYPVLWCATNSDKAPWGETTHVQVGEQ